MKIDTTSQIRRTAGKSGVKSKAPADGTFADNLSITETPLPQEIVDISSLSAMPGLLSIQEFPSLSPEDRKHILNSEKILNNLDALQLALISGKISASTLESLKNNIGEEWKTSQDPQLKSLLEEIEIRGAVELAKLERAS
ncbi:Flagellar assembly protein FliX [Candidatus Bealeia paramacronuclearis]|uniref:Flagellar assembly protein FliX n=1 Tax=Candidatus Bealeia paramacronuclearis TaxID=1921001 RepID=A0ABZ2C3I3_9PROT|nr:Flagellar assembly protein FliX [Candidatus Bealeia paramacronuclearis]